MHFPVPDMHPADVFEEKKGNGALQPLFEVLLNLLLPVRIAYLYYNVGLAIAKGILAFPKPLRLGEALAMKTNREGWREESDAITETEGALKTNPSETDGMQGSLVRVPKTAEGGELFFREILAVVFEDERPVFDTHRGFRGAGIVCILQKLRKHMSGALYLLKKLVPGPGEFRIPFQLIPPLCGVLAHGLIKRRLCSHLGTSFRASSSEIVVHAGHPKIRFTLEWMANVVHLIGPVTTRLSHRANHSPGVTGAAP